MSGSAADDWPDEVFDRLRESQPELSNSIAAVQKAMQTDLPEAVRLVTSWNTKVKGPPLKDESARGLGETILQLISSGYWHDTRNSERESDLARVRRVVKLMRDLQAALPRFIETYRNKITPVPMEVTAELLNLLDAHQPWMESLPPRGQGRARSMESDVAAHLSNQIFDLWSGAGDKGRADAFAAIALQWVMGRKVAISDQAVGKSRTRRT